jgi:hypothetical protein
VIGMARFGIRFGHTENPCGTHKHQPDPSSRLVALLEPESCFHSLELNLAINLTPSLLGRPMRAVFLKRAVCSGHKCWVWSDF